MLGQVAIYVIHTTKLLSGSAFGLMAIEQSNGQGPYFATPGVGAPGTRHTVTFCYKESTNVPSFIVDGVTMGDYKINAGAKYPSTRNAQLSFLTGSHSSDTVR